VLSFRTSEPEGLAVVLFGGRPAAGDYEEYVRVCYGLDRIARLKERSGLIVVHEDGYPPPNARDRSRLAECARQTTGTVRVCVVTRSIPIRGTLWLIRRLGVVSFNATVRPDFPGAVGWMESELGRELGVLYALKEACERAILDRVGSQPAT
jgi:hypothetical protein